MTVLAKQFALLIVVCAMSILLHGQTKTTISESLTGISDSLLKKEIASFTIKGSSFYKADSLSKATLIEIPIRNCSDKEVHLSWSTFAGPVSTFIHLYFKGQVPDKTLDTIALVTHSHFLVRFPRAAFQGLNQPNACSFSRGGKKSKFFSPYYKAFYSADKKRLYIYMLGGIGSGKYEVTWVIVEDRYYTRILDTFP